LKEDEPNRGELFFKKSGFKTRGKKYRAEKVRNGGGTLKERKTKRSKKNFKDESRKRRFSRKGISFARQERRKSLLEETSENRRHLKTENGRRATIVGVVKERTQRNGRFTSPKKTRGN